MANVEKAKRDGEVYSVVSSLNTFADVENIVAVSGYSVSDVRMALSSLNKQGVVTYDGSVVREVFSFSNPRKR